MENIHLWTTLFLLLAGQGLALSFLFILGKKYKYPPNRYLSLFLFIQTTIILFCVVYWNEWQIRWVHLTSLLAPLPYLIGPALWAYFQTLAKRKLELNDIKHIIPFFGFTLYFSPFYFLGTENKYAFFTEGHHLDAWWQWGHWACNMGHLISLSAYAFFFFHISKKYQTEKEPSLENRLLEKERKWLHVLSRLFVGYVATYFLYYIMVGKMGAPIWVDFLIVLAGSAMIFAIGWMGFERPELFRQQEKEAVEKYRHSSLSNPVAKEREKQLVLFFENEKTYLDPDFKLATLSEKLGIPKHHLSELFNQYMHTSFTELVNGYRIAHARRLLENGAARQLTLQAIGFESGFTSRSNFHKVFKKITGLTPSEYRKRQANVSRTSD